MSRMVRGVLIAALIGVLVGVPSVIIRSTYAFHKRLREVDPGRLYRCGQETAEGFADAVKRHGIRTIVNLQVDFPDPDIEYSFWRPGTIKESKLCEQLGVRYVWIAPDVVSPRSRPEQRPKAIDEFLKLMDDPTVYPVLIHCKAGLNRTGCMAAIYRMEYQGWTPAEACREMRELGFGTTTCTASNLYVLEYVLAYRRGLRYPVFSPAVAQGK